ncbi:MAG: transporter substrate-binding domain-containing protein [Mariprofundaceae bacterium]
MRQFIKLFLVAITVVLILPNMAMATGPRVTTALFSAEKNEIHTTDFPPFVSTDLIDGGVITEIVHEALKRASIEAAITTHPVQRMVRYYLFQENVMAVMGRHLKFSAEEKKQLIFIPVMVMSEKLYYYKPAHPDGLNIEAESIKSLTYGAHRGEDVSRYEQAGAAIHYGRPMALLKKMKSGDVDFIEMPPRAVEWLVDRYMHEQKGQFGSLPEKAHDEVMYVFFNRQHKEGETAAKAFKKALADMKLDGSYAKVIDKYLGDEGKLYLRRLESFQ